MPAELVHSITVPAEEEEAELGEPTDEAEATRPADEQLSDAERSRTQCSTLASRTRRRATSLTTCSWPVLADDEVELLLESESMRNWSCRIAGIKQKSKRNRAKMHTWRECRGVKSGSLQ